VQSASEKEKSKSESGAQEESSMRTACGSQVRNNEEKKKQWKEV